ncbi:DNA topoisomerase [Clostridium sp. AM25-23AC]|uniref:DNA topoisomerase n=1 Tax=Clostridium sp. AM25-23AC TaxID=2305240 RepID=UPI000E40C1D0|nr:DNA topoisomerase [Clostridium sp. AM25-23AC]RGD97563.1 type IA DNA topoisomerase [Clostridium sp. AM25-23AC]
MGKALFIAEKPSVAQEFAKALKVSGRKGDGYIESDQAIVTWCVGHLVTMSYPDAYDPALKRWSMETLPFLPKTFKYQVIDDVKKQFKIVSGLLNRADVDTIYVCTDSGREGEYIYRLVEQMAAVKGKNRRRVWIDSQTEDEILRGVREAKDLAEYDNLAASAYLRAKEDYLMGINFSRVLTLRYGPSVASYLREKRAVLSVGRVMTCVLGMVVRREREIREFVKTPFYRVIGSFDVPDHETAVIEAEWRAVEGSRYFGTPALYKENGFKEQKTAEELIRFLSADPMEGTLIALDKKKETKNPPLLYNLAEIQNDCSKMFKISPDETLKIIQELYEKKLVTYPRTDARVLSTAVAKEIYKNIGGLRNFGPLADFAAKVLDGGTWKQIAGTKYVNDKQITDHYAIIPTGQGFGALRSLNPLAAKVYELIGRRFLSIFYPPAVYQKFSLQIEKQGEQFFAVYKVLAEAGYLKVANVPSKKKTDTSGNSRGENSGAGQENQTEELDPGHDEKAKNLLAMLSGLKKGQKLKLLKFDIKEGETSPPKRYTSGSMILAMENAGQLIEDEDLRAQIKGSGIGTSATRAEILKKLFNIKYLALAKKTQVITPTLLGEIVFDVCQASMRQLLNPELTASWEKGLTYVAEGTITPDEYMEKLERFVTLRTNGVKQTNNAYMLRPYFDAAAQFYKK